MPGAEESALGLASWLRSLPDEDLAALIAARELRESSVKDWFDLAEALLRPDSIGAALARLDRETLAALRRGSPSAEAERLALAYDGSVPAVVVDAIPALEPGPAPAALVPVAQVDQRFTDRLAAEHAYRTTAAVVELLDVLEREPAKALARGGIALPDAKRLSLAMGVELDEVPPIMGIAERAGLAVAEGGRWMPAGEWTSASWGERWARLAEAWLERLPDDIRRLLAERAGAEWGERLTDAVDWLYPLGGGWMRDRIAVYTRDAALLGITADNVPSTAGGLLLTNGPDAAGTAMADGFPPTVDTVYLQHDLSVVAPGALRPDLDARLRALADRDGASTYRVSAASVTRALALGWTEDELRAFLGTVSRTGIPQPLDYLLRETAGRYGTVRVRARGVGSEVRSAEELQLRTILADSALSHLGFVREGDALRSGYERDIVFWSLADARYPVAAEDDHGGIETVARHHGSPPVVAERSTLVERLRLRAADPADDAQAWMLRQLDLAIRAKVALTVTVAMPGGALVDYVLEPASVAGGRLRARDRTADIERTLPLTSIAAIRPA